ncbi:Putative L-type lectin-domain containing receptor kinase I.4 [Leucoagaricus sp. SymC.cos]|nr:Putative L-type lectin-domain containing receptor kinase I.4 [Leucoagaricus sp. SymC.cos]
MSVHPTGLSGIHEPRKDDILIAFMGPTGVGKSYFIDLLTGQSGKRAGHTLKSVTADIQATRVRHPVHGDRVVLVDTPGFDNTTRTDMEIFVMINDWLAKVYKSDVKLIEFIYLHRITDNRMFGPYNDLRIFGIFGWLCNVVATHVTLVSTMWEKIDPAVGAKTEGQLRELLLWKNLIDKGSGVDRLQRSDPRDAWRIVNQLINRGTEREVLLQEEIVDLERGRLNGAKTFCTQQQKVLSDKKEALKSLLAQVEKSDDPKLKKKLEEGLDQFEKDWLLMKELQRQIKRSGSGGEQRFLKRFSLLADLDWQHKDASMANRIARGLLLQIVRSTSIVKTVAGASVILAHKNNAQLLVNYMDMVLREGHVAMPDDQNRILTLLSKIVVSHGVIPEYHKLSSIKLQDTSAGSGTYGVVFRGLQDDSVCVKVMRNEHKLEQHAQEYLKELILWAHISHDNILPLHGVFLKQKMEISLVSPWMENGNLKDYVKATKDRQESRMPLVCPRPNLSRTHLSQALSLSYLTLSAAYLICMGSVLSIATSREYAYHQSFF